MNPTGLYLAVLLGDTIGAKMAAWNALPEAKRKARDEKGMAAWSALAQNHQVDIAEIGGPLGKTKRVGANEIADVSNAMTAFTVVRAASAEAAAQIFANQPHFSIILGECAEIMPALPRPTVWTTFAKGWRHENHG